MSATRTGVALLAAASVAASAVAAAAAVVGLPHAVPYSGGVHSDAIVGGVYCQQLEECCETNCLPSIIIAIFMLAFLVVIILVFIFKFCMKLPFFAARNCWGLFDDNDDDDCCANAERRRLLSRDLPPPYHLVVSAGPHPAPPCYLPTYEECIKAQLV